MSERVAESVVEAFTAPPPVYAAGRPMIDVYLRLVNVTRDFAEELFDGARDFYRTIGVNLIATGPVEERPDIADWAVKEGVDGKLTVDVELLCSTEWRLGQYWINVFFIGPLGVINLGTGVDEEIESLEGEHYAQRGSLAPGVGVIIATMNPSYWGLLAHELAHCLGLPHVYNGPDDPGADLVADGLTYNELAMAPFPDDTRQLYEDPGAFDWHGSPPDGWDASDPLVHNLMTLTSPKNSAWLLPSQVDRIRLTIVSRQGGVQVAEDARANYPGSPTLPFIPLVDTCAAVLRSFL